MSSSAMSGSRRVSPTWNSRSRAINAEREIATANWPGIRVAKIPLATAPTPQTDVRTTWRVAAPANAGSFTAIGYFFARELHHRTGVPIGIIDSTWGGTRVEAWVSREGLSGVWPGVDAELQEIAAAAPDLPRIRAAYQAKLDVWEKTVFPQDMSDTGEPAGWAKPGFDDRAWRTLPLPNTVQSQGLAANGAFWFRRTLDLPASAAGHNLVLSLGAIDDFDTTYFNGERVGGLGPETYGAYLQPRRYTVPGRLVHAGPNTIAVRVFDRFGDGGFMGPADRLQAEVAGTSIPLEGIWRWQIEREIPPVSSSIYATQPPAPAALQQQNQATALYNAMIAPLVGYGLRGFIWYQGEANVTAHATYQDRFTALIRDWRDRWGEGTLPFYFVQLASFTENGQWPWLREAQTRTLAEPATGMAVTIDIGNAHDIHPRNKQDVGRRLALLALAGANGGKNVIATGPMLARVEISGAAARIFWRESDGLRTHDGTAAVAGFALAGADGVYHPADARIDGDTVVVTSPAVPAPQGVRYAWADCPEVNLENGAGLPAAPFRTDAR
jgi:sialate O-acetylesterase